MSRHPWLLASQARHLAELNSLKGNERLVMAWLDVAERLEARVVF